MSNCAQEHVGMENTCSQISFNALSTSQNAEAFLAPEKLVKVENWKMVNRAPGRKEITGSKNPVEPTSRKQDVEGQV